LVAHVGATPEAALRMAITTPAKVVGQDHRAVLIGQNVQNLNLLSDQLAQTRPFTDVFAQAVAHDAAE
jgi:N-acetylglucosamine-6-phosphate deacetylase